jgi:hypothetical protein
MAGAAQPRRPRRPVRQRKHARAGRSCRLCPGENAGLSAIFPADCRLIREAFGLALVAVALVWADRAAWVVLRWWIEQRW